MPKGLQPIYKQVMANSTTDSLSFKNIPQHYTDLILIVSVRNTGSGIGQDFNMQFNSEAGLGCIPFGRTFMYGSKNATGTVEVIQQSDMSSLVTIYHPAAGATANIFSNGVVRIPNYATSQYKQLVQEYALETTGGGTTSHILAGYNHHSKLAEPISLIRIWQNVSGNFFVAGSTFSLYGLSKA